MSQESPLTEERVSKGKIGFWTYFWGFWFVLVLGIVVSFFRLTRRVHIEGMEHLQGLPRKNVLYTPNHPSMLDFFLLLFVIAGWRGLFNPRRIPWQVPDRKNFKWLTWLTFGSFEVLRLIPVDRDDRGERNDMRALRKLLRILPVSHVLLFLEGGRSANQPKFLSTTSGVRIGEPKEGIGALIFLRNPIIVPILLKGAESVMPIGNNILHVLWNIWWHKIVVTIGESFQCEEIDVTSEDEKSEGIKEFAYRARKGIADLDSPEAHS